jgi:signal transduction histidine kinase/ActR/RegA family two-component response regulator
MANDAVVDQEAALRFMALMRLAGLDTFVIEGDTVTPSASVCRAFGLPEGQPVERAFFDDHIHPDDAPSAVAVAERLRQEGGSATVELRLKHGEGWRWVRSTLMTEVRADGRVLVHGIEQDITEIAQARDAAVRATETKSRFLASMSHEIRTPMNGILGVLHLLRAEPLSDGGRQLLDEALQCGHMLSELINDILDLSKIEADQMRLSPEPTDPAAAVRGVVNMLRAQGEAKGLTLTVEGAEDCGWRRVDPVRLRQVLFNLIGNAVKFTHEGTVRVRMETVGEGEAGRLRFEIVDTGIGIAPEARERLFGRFQQADDSATRQFGGTGLGLAISRHLVRLMGGEVGFNSVLGQGSTFRFDVAAPEAMTPAAPVRAATEGRGLDRLRILVVEDNPANRMIVCRILQNLGAEVETAEDGAAGVSAVERFAPDVVLMDVQMPGMDGLEATRRIRALSGPAGAAPIIALTANVLEHQKADCLRTGMNGVVSKPIAPTVLVAEIQRVTAPRTAARRRRSA